MSILKLKPACKSYLWGGDRLKKEYNKSFSGPVLAETWELSCHPDGASTIAAGPFSGQTLPDYLDAAGADALGTNCARFSQFPILIKLIDARDTLSVQVHPGDSYALEHEGQLGKTEMWYVLDCEPGAFLYYGLKKEVDRDTFSHHAEAGTLDEILNAVPVQKGDTFFIETGTVHAIGKGIVVAEIQQNSNVTYRVYDYNRADGQGNRRPLHLEQALAVAQLGPPRHTHRFGGHLAASDSFLVDRLSVQSGTAQGQAGADSFHALLIVDGAGVLSCGGARERAQKGDCFFIPANSGIYTATGDLTLLRVTVPPRPSYRIGVDLGGTAVKVGIIDSHNRIVGRAQLPTGRDRPWEAVVETMVRGIREALADAAAAPDDCTAAGVGCPGTIDAESGTVLYSNNLGWRDVPLAEALRRALALPVSISNDANCAALGEVLAGAAQGCKNAVLLTLGTGVGSGIILDGCIFEGSGPGAAELGHTMLRQGGEPCSCGRRGCLEAYASATALIREARAAAKRHPGSALAAAGGADGAEIDGALPFALAAQRDTAAVQVVERYLDDLADGIADTVNLLRPQMVLLGGGISRQGPALTEPLADRVAHRAFGGGASYLPDIRCALLENDAGMIGAANIL